MADKHAYLIIAHSEPLLLKTLVSLIDDERNDIFIHIDKKVNINEFSEVRAIKSNLLFLDKRIDVHWGNLSIVEVEFLLFETAKQYGSYKYYHLLSGVDLPIHNQDYIHSFIEKIGNDKEFVSIASDSDLKNKKDILHKTDQYWFFTDNIRRNGTFKSLLSNFFASVFVNIQRILGIHRKFEIEIRKSCQFMSITDDLCDYLLQNKSNILKTFKYTLAPDEYAIQAFILNSEFNKRRYLPDEPENSDMRLIDWNRGTPYVWQMSDFDELINSEKFFARKFSSKNMDIVQALYKHIKE